MPYRARVERYSVGPAGQRLISVVATFPRIVLAEVVTHRACSDAWVAERTTTRDMSKNSASSRAIPLARMIQAVMDDPYIPERFSAAGPGMQGSGWLDGADHEAAVGRWLHARDRAVIAAMGLLNNQDFDVLADKMPLGFFSRLNHHHSSVWANSWLTQSVHKQDVNRLLEPWMWVTQIITATWEGWSNFFALRCHKAAHPAFQRVARMIYLRVRDCKEIDHLEHGQWHLPFVEREIVQGFRWHGSLVATGARLPFALQASAARCAWLSYENHEKEAGPEAIERTYDRLFAEIPVHASPVEHQATPVHLALTDTRPELRSNFAGWLQARKLIPMEAITDYQPSPEEVASWGDLPTDE